MRGVLGEEGEGVAMSLYKCFKCVCQQCTFRIWTDDGLFDEVACYRHAHDLEVHADQILGNPGIGRHHLTSSKKLCRDAKKAEPLPAGRKDCMDCHTPLSLNDRQAGAVRCNECARKAADVLVYSGPGKNHS